MPINETYRTWIQLYMSGSFLPERNPFEQAYAIGSTAKIAGI